MHLNWSPGNWRPFCLGINVLNKYQRLRRRWLYYANHNNQLNYMNIIQWNCIWNSQIFIFKKMYSKMTSAKYDHFVQSPLWDFIWENRDTFNPSFDEFHIMTWCHNMGMLSSWASCQVRKIAGAHAPGMLGTFSPPPQVSDPDMHYGTCVTHVPWCMPGSLTSGFLWSRPVGKTFPAFPAHAQPAISRIW